MWVCTIIFYIAAIKSCKEGIGIAYADITTGEFFTTEFENLNCISKVMAELFRIGAKEIIISNMIIT